MMADPIFAKTSSSKGINELEELIAREKLDFERRSEAEMARIAALDIPVFEKIEMLFVPNFSETESPEQLAAERRLDLLLFNRTAEDRAFSLRLFNEKSAENDAIIAEIVRLNKRLDELLVTLHSVLPLDVIKQLMDAFDNPPIDEDDAPAEVFNYSLDGTPPNQVILVGRMVAEALSKTGGTPTGFSVDLSDLSRQTSASPSAGTRAAQLAQFYDILRPDRLNVWTPFEGAAFIDEDRAGTDGTGFAVSLGASYAVDPGLSLGLAARYRTA